MATNGDRNLAIDTRSQGCSAYSSDLFPEARNTSVDSDPHGGLRRVTFFVEKPSRRRRGRNAASGNHLDPA